MLSCETKITEDIVSQINVISTKVCTITELVEIVNHYEYSGLYLEITHTFYQNKSGIQDMADVGWVCPY